MTTKAQNYTPEQTTQMVQGYQAGETVEALAQALGKSTRSVVAKLSREGVYVPKTKAPGTAPAVKKADLVDRLALKLNVAPEVVDSLEKATKETLELLVEALEA